MNNLWGEVRATGALVTTQSRLETILTLGNKYLTQGLFGFLIET